VSALPRRFGDRRNTRRLFEKLVSGLLAGTAAWLLTAAAAAAQADGDGTTPLHRAAYQDDVARVEALIRSGANVNAATDLGVTPLWLAAQNGSEAVLKALLAAGANPNAALLAGETPVMVAARAGKTPVVALLLAKGANANARGPRKQTALMWAVAQKHPDVVKVLLAGGADLSLRSERWTQVMAVPPHGYLPYNREIPAGDETALLFAARVGDLESARLLVTAGADVNDADAWGVSAVTLAAHSGFADLLDFLLETGADPKAMKAGFAPLHEAIMRRDGRMVASLLAHGADPNAALQTWTPTRRSSEDWNFAPELVGATPFWLAARFTEPAVMAMLLEHGADPMFVHHGERMVEGRGEAFQRRLDTTTTLMAATGMGGGRVWVPLPAKDRQAAMLEAVKMCLARGVDVNAANNDGRTALDAATTLKYESVVAFLKEHGGRAGAKPAAVFGKP
jgi:ankyrin repeat protein